MTRTKYYPWLGALLATVAFSSTPNEDPTGGNAQSTADTLQYIADRAEDGNWEWEIDVDKFNRDLYGAKIRNPSEAFATPYREIQVCPDEMRVDLEGETACVVYDNAMRYVYNKNENTAPYNHIIPQKVGSDQEAMETYIQPGDIIVYFHPEDREGYLGDAGMQWRMSHAATVVHRDGVLATADTPAGYAQPFTGVDETPFHVLRFMPKDENGEDLSDELAQHYRSMIAKWATLGFEKFEFTNDYNSAAGKLTGPESIAEYGDLFLKAALTDRWTEIDPMYCAWFVYTNLALGWMHPINESGLEGFSFGAQVLSGASFDNISDGFAFDTYVDEFEGLVGHDDYPFEPFTGYELINGFISRLVGLDDPSLPPQVFAAQAMNKAGILQALANDPNIMFTFSSSPDHVPNYDDQTANEFNQLIPQMVLEFAGLYAELAQKVSLGEISVAGAHDSLIDRYTMRRRERDQVYDDVAKRWIPPYIFAYIAENFNRLERKNERPVLAYIGTVVHEKFLRHRDSTGEGDDRVSVFPSLDATTRDIELDKKMYELLGQDVKEDGKGYQAFFACLADADRDNCGDGIKRHFNPAEAEALMSMANDWKYGAELSEREVLVRNRFGLDPVRMRRLLASYWNNPQQAFRPNIFDDPGAQVKKSVSNFRILMNSPLSINDEQADAASYESRQRFERMNCIPNGDPIKAGDAAIGIAPTCELAITEAEDRSYDLSEDSPDGDYQGWPAMRFESDEVDPVEVEEPLVCAKLYTAKANRGRKLQVYSGQEIIRIDSAFNNKLTSMKLTEGCSISVYTGYNFNIDFDTGEYRSQDSEKTYTAPETEESRVNWELEDTEFDNRISSLKCSCASEGGDSSDK